VLYEQARDESHVRECAGPIYSTMTFVAEGLVLGAGTVIVPTEGSRRLESLRGQEARILALLSAFYDGPTAPSALGNIERAAKAWREGDICLAYIHLAHAVVSRPRELRSGAYRLEMAQCALKCGSSPRAVFKALHLDARYIAAIEKAYNPDEPRVPAGSGSTSGEWTSGDVTTGGADAATDGTSGDRKQGSSFVARMALPASSVLGDLGAGQVAELGAYASRLLSLGPIGAAVAAFGLLFIPSPNDIHVEGEVPEIPGLRYSWNRDETWLSLTYDRGDEAQRTFALQVDGDFIRDDDGKVVGHVIGGNRIALDTFALLPDLVKEDEPRLCPAPAPDAAGSDQGRPYEENRARQYEDFVKLLINLPPTGPTPSGFVYYLPNPQDGDPTSYDDCKWSNGILFEIKGERYAELLKSPLIVESIAEGFIKQSGRQIAASQGRPIVWIFAEPEAAEFARRLFDSTDEGRERITVVYVPWTRKIP
jgi:hypothetical protein